LNTKNLKNIGNISYNNFLFDKNSNKEKKYFVQLGIFAKPHEVDKIKARISLLGLNPNIKNYLLNGKLTKKVTLRPYLNYKIFESILRKLEENQIKYLILNE
jgi:cell division protein FtsN